MIRHEGKDIFVRYDGTETRVDIHRGREMNGLSVDELEELILTLEDALENRLRFLKQMQAARRKNRASAQPKRTPKSRRK